MDIQEQSAKLKYFQERAFAQAREAVLRGDPGKDVGCATNECKQASLRDRVQNQLHHALRDQEKAFRMRELADLLDKHPDVARIFELMDAEGLRG